MGPPWGRTPAHRCSSVPRGDGVHEREERKPNKDPRGPLISQVQLDLQRAPVVCRTKSTAQAPHSRSALAGAFPGAAVSLASLRPLPRPWAPSPATICLSPTPNAPEARSPGPRCGRRNDEAQSMGGPGAAVQAAVCPCGTDIGLVPSKRFLRSKYCSVGRCRENERRANTATTSPALSGADSFSASSSAERPAAGREAPPPSLRKHARA